MRHISIITLSSLVLLLVPSVAQSQTANDGVRFLLGFEQPPSVLALQNASIDPASDLQLIALDESEDILFRRRAVLLLSNFPEARTITFLSEILRDASQGALRRASASALTTMLINNDPQRLLTLLRPLLQSADPDDREQAVRLISQVAIPEAEQILGRHRIIERNRNVVEALRQTLVR